MTSGMSVSVVEHPPVANHLPFSVLPATMSRPQVGIERLPPRRTNNEPRESMNCKSCRKRKRLKDQKKDGSSKDSGLDGLDGGCADGKDSKSGKGTEEAGTEKVTGNGTGVSPASESSATVTTSPGERSATANGENGPVFDPPTTEPKKRAKPQTKERIEPNGVVDDPTNDYPPPRASSERGDVVPIELLLHTYFARFHAKPFHILDESSFRQRLQHNQVPSWLLGSVCALASRYTHHPSGYQASVSLGEEYARRARAEIDSDEPSIDCLQALLLLALAFVASGKGKKSYMLLSNAIGMAVAMELHREVDITAGILPVEREMRRRLFWTCYLLDRFMACGSRRPSLINDSTVLLRLPCWLPSPGAAPIEGDFFQSASNLQYLQGGEGKKSQGGSGMLIDISRILGITNRYLAAGGVKGDSHFPWHSLSNLSKIRQDLDVWASGAQHIFSTVEALFGQPDSTVLVMSKLIYHLIHCLIYRPFLPVDLAELCGSGQHQSWQIEATNMCFLHANAIAELIELGKQMPQIEWPGFVGYCICTAGTVHVHGAHYKKTSSGNEISVFNDSAEFLAREIQQLTELRHAWACVQHHRQTLQDIYNAHTALVEHVTNNHVRYSPVFQLEDFFDRYLNIGGPGGPSFCFDASNLVLADIVVDFMAESYVEHDPNLPNMALEHGHGGAAAAAGEGHRVGSGDGNGLRVSEKAVNTTATERANLKRKKIVPPIALLANNNNNTNNTKNTNGSQLQTPLQHQVPFSAEPFSSRLAPELVSPSSNLCPPLPHDGVIFHHGAPHHIAEVSGFSVPTHMESQTQSQTRLQQQQQQQQQQQDQRIQSATPYGPAFNFPTLAPNPNSTAPETDIELDTGFNIVNANSPQVNGHRTTPGGPQAELSGYDPMFAATLATNAFSSPSPWPTDDANGNSKQTGAFLQRSPGDGSNDGSTGVAITGEEKDPFLSLLEQLAENEYARAPGNELDFFLNGGSTAI
ncbi:Transcription factor [Niveomyces insectorum RCEF 264]|uniref:Transcription factor n=1 Tax=Niveomyces insectorum RCEF 264 TaxID=1081102 RepID=A0A167VFA1_9HYPO|nr:Transcription factor [Niveomyces insectorum RCEF 264]